VRVVVPPPVIECDGAKAVLERAREKATNQLSQRAETVSSFEVRHLFLEGSPSDGNTRWGVVDQICRVVDDPMVQ
jgi:hypothetical protein